MRDGEERSPRLKRLVPAKRASCQPQLRRTSMAEHFDVLPQDAARMPGAERLHRGFLRGKAAGEARDRIAVMRTISNLAVGENTVEEAVAVPLQYVAEARNIGGVEPEPDDGHARSSAYRRLRMGARAVGARAAMHETARATSLHLA